MIVPISCAIASSILLLAVLRKPGTARTLWASEQSAHSAAVEKQFRDRRSGTTDGTLSVLGEGDGQASCRILKISRSALRIASQRRLREGAQVHVQWGDEFFIGTVYRSFQRKNEQIAGLQLLAANHSASS